MAGTTKPHVLVLGGNFAGLTTARLIRQRCEEQVNITVIDRKPYLIFVPNIPLAVLANHDPAERLHMHIVDTLDDDDIRFIQADVTEVDVDSKRVTYVPNERPGAAVEHIGYDYLVIALGARLAYDQIEGFGEYGFTVSDSYYGNRLRRYLFGGEYRGGPIAIGSARFHQGHSPAMPDWLPIALGACEGPPLEMGLSMAAWLQDRDFGGPESITLFTPADKIAEDAGEEIVKEFLGMAKDMGFGYVNNTEDVRCLTHDGIEFANGDSLEAEVKIVLPDWVPHAFLQGLPISDDMGFIVTDRLMRNPDYPEVLAAGDAAAITVPKLGALGDFQARIVAKQIAKDVGKMSAEDADDPYWPQILCFGDMGNHKAFYIHSDTWFGGDTSIFKMGYLYYGMKIAFKEMYFTTGGKPPQWGVPLTEFVADDLA